MKRKHRAILIMLATAAILAFSVSAYSYRRSIDSQRASVDVRTDFPKAYAEQNRGKVQFDTPMVYELLNIVTMLSAQERTGLAGGYNDYHRAVMDRFGPFRSHPAVAAIRSANERMGYSHVRNLMIYDLSEGQLVPGGIYSGTVYQDRLKPLLADLQDFAQISGFTSFYREHSKIYDDLAKEYQKSVPVERMWRWLEEQFSHRQDALKVVISPLTAGSHNTFNYTDPDDRFSEAVMFVSGPRILDKLQPASEPVSEGLLSQMLFTEIDHNYVNPVTNRELNVLEVTKALRNLAQWNRYPDYGRPVLTFNEYMTWGTFLLYARETYDESSYTAIENATLRQMENRGFIRFAAFSAKLHELYRSRPAGQMVESLFPSIIAWCQAQS